MIFLHPIWVSKLLMEPLFWRDPTGINQIERDVDLKPFLVERKSEYKVKSLHPVSLKGLF